MRILIYYPYFTDTIGGGEYIPLTIARELQLKHEVVLLTRTDFSFEKVESQYGVRLDKSKIKVYNVTPQRPIDRFWNILFRHYEALIIRRWARESDICMSCHDVKDFGRPGVHFMCMANFDHLYNKWLTGTPVPKRKISHRIFRLVFDSIRNIFIVRIRKPREIFADPRERIFPNSHYVAKAVAGYYGRTGLEVFYPPTLFEPAPPTADRKGVVYIGRIDAAKRVDFIIEVVEKVRELTKVDLTLDIAGFVNDDEYGKRIVTMSSARPWVRLLGPVVGEAKRQLLARSQYAVHACTDENFGISVTEYLKAGIITIVPKIGGAYEVVDCHELSYGTREEALELLGSLIKDDSLRAKMHDYCAIRGKRFSRNVYLESQKKLLAQLVSSNS